jgi:RNA polymerase sigma-70 factor (ECF subfamily)
MSGSADSRTSPTLLGRLRDQADDQAAWAAFVDRYGPLILGWCRTARLQDADAEDVTQHVLLRLATRLRTFAYDPARSFRGWLRTVTQGALSDFWSDRYRDATVQAGDDALSALNTAAARDDLLERLNSQFDLELLEEATERVRLRVEPQTWEAFRLTALDGVSGTDAAERLGVRVTAVYKAKSRVQELIREELASLERDDA